MQEGTEFPQFVYREKFCGKHSNTEIMFLWDVRQYTTVTQDLLRYNVQTNTAPLFF
jgi:hypothetical protein